MSEENRSPAVPISMREVLAYQTVIEIARQVVADYKNGSDRSIGNLEAAIKKYDEVAEVKSSGT
ncbi:MAG TPA: hypothetical protein V6C76_11605 [Drouetiella sp.]